MNQIFLAINSQLTDHQQTNLRRGQVARQSTAIYRRFLTEIDRQAIKKQILPVGGPEDLAGQHRSA